MILSESPRIEIIHGDCMDYMDGLEPKAFQLAIVDPPYGLGDRLVKGGAKGGMGTMQNLADDKVTTWDDKIPPPEYFTELKRVSKNQIIWGGNYFLDYLGKTDGFIVWDKMNGTNSMADAELAWQNIKGTTRMFRWHHFSGERTNKIHPTQKPVKLYRWLLQNYAKQGDRILDTHLGSGSSAIACYEEGFDFVGIELDKDYYDAAVKRFRQHIAQGSLF
jgi:site-specific DNA-methyltransferase (adenine-specific)